jgi:uncharacterized protein
MNVPKVLAWLIGALLAVALAGNAVFGYAVLKGGRSNVPAPDGAVAGSTAGQYQITVTSDGSVEAVPDVAYLSVGVETRATNAREAMDLNASAMQRVLEAFTGAGVRPDELRTEMVSLYPIMGQVPDDVSAPETVRSYAASDSVKVTITDLSQTGKVLDAAVQAGATSSYGIEFAVRDDARLRDQALANATAAARARAEVAAQQLGARLGPLTSLSEEPISTGPVAKGMGGAGGPPIQPGELTFSTRVHASYSFQP